MTKYWNQGAGHGDHALGPALPAPAEGSYVRVPTPGAPRDMVLTDLQPGDLLLMSAPDRAHVAVYLGQGQTIEADSDGVVIQALTDALQDDRLAAAWRRTDFNADDAQALVRWLRTQEGRPYESAPQLLSGGNDDEAWYCSELVFTGFDTIGKPLVEADAGLDLPGAALTLTSVDYVGHIKRPGREQPMPQPQSRPLGPFTPDQSDRDAMVPAGRYGQTVDASTLEVGDLIVVSSDHVVSEAIRRRTGSPASHLALFIGDGEVVEAIASGVEKRALATVLAETHYAAAYRYAGLSGNEKNQIKDFAVGEWRRGARYDLLAIASLQSTQQDEAWFCSELVFAAYESAGIRLGDPTQSTPGQVINMQGVEYLGHLPAGGDRSMSMSPMIRRPIARSRPMEGGGAIGALGFEILTSVVTGSAGNITYNFDQLRGRYSALHRTWSPEQRAAHDAPNHQYTNVRMESRQSYWDLGTISAAVPITFDHNGYYVANLRLSAPLTDEHLAYSMRITGEISEDPSVYETETGEQTLSRINLRIMHVIDYDWLGETFFDDTAEIIEDYEIYSNGSVWCRMTVSGTWFFDETSAQAPIRISNGELYVTSLHPALEARLRQASAQSMTAGGRASQPMPAGEDVHWESEPFRVLGTGSRPVQRTAQVSSRRRRLVAARPRPMSSGDVRIENAVQAAMRHGASEDEARAFFAHEASLARRGARAMTAGNAFPTISMVDSDGWIARMIGDVAALAFPADANPMQVLFNFCTDNNLTIAIGLTAGVGFYEAANVGLGVVVAPGNQVGYYGSVSYGVGWNFEGRAGVQVTVIEGGTSVFTGVNVVIGGSLDLSAGPSLGVRAILNTAGNIIGWTAEVTWTIGVPVASAFEFTVSIQQTHAQFTRVRSQSLALAQTSYGPMIGGLPLRRNGAGNGTGQAAPQVDEGWAGRSAARMRNRRRIWA